MFLLMFPLSTFSYFLFVLKIEGLKKLEFAQSTADVIQTTLEGFEFNLTLSLAQLPFDVFV